MVELWLGGILCSTPQQRRRPPSIQLRPYAHSCGMPQPACRPARPSRPPTHLVDGHKDEERLQAVHPAQQPPKSLNLRLQPLHQLAVAAGRRATRQSAALLPAARAAVAASSDTSTQLSTCAAQQGTPGTAGHPLPAHHAAALPVVGPSGIPRSEGDPELDRVRLKSKLLQGGSQSHASVGLGAAPQPSVSPGRPPAAAAASAACSLALKNSKLLR